MINTVLVIIFFVGIISLAIVGFIAYHILAYKSDFPRPPSVFLEREKMYYEEKIINGILHWRGTPDGEFIAYSAEAITNKLIESRAETRAMINGINALTDKISNEVPRDSSIQS